MSARILLVVAVVAALWAADGASAQQQQARPTKQAGLTRQQRIDRARALFVEGQRAYDAGDLTVALAKFRGAYEAFSTADLAFNLARVYERMSDAPNAIRYYRIYLQCGHPTDRDRATVEGRIAALEDVQRRQQEQIYTAPPSRDALTAEAREWFLRGVAFYRRRQYEQAMQAFTAANGFAPLPEVVYNIAVTSERLERLQDAIDYYREYLRLRPDAPDKPAVEEKIRALRAQRQR